MDTVDFKYTNSSILHDVNELTWLSISNSTQPFITLNETNTVYHVSMNTVSKIKITNNDDHKVEYLLVKFL